MLLTGLAFRPSDHRVDNTDLVAMVLERSRLQGDAARRVEHTLTRLLDHTGARRRYWTAAPGDLPDVIDDALDAALRRAGRRRSEIDLLISTSVDRSVLEPSHAALLTALTGTVGAQCFDVTDGCNGWLRATQIAQGMLAGGACRCVAVVATEFSMMPEGAFLSDVLRVGDGRSLRTGFPPLTLGDGVAVAILEDGGTDWTYAFRNRSDLVDLCYAPLPESRRYRSREARRTWRDDVLFVVDGPGLFREAAAAIPPLLADAGADIDAVDDVVVHGATSRRWARGATEVGRGGNLRNAFPEYGNVVSASIPAALATALPDASAPRDVLSIGASAGMSFALARFTLDPAAIDRPARTAAVATGNGQPRPDAASGDEPLPARHR